MSDRELLELAAKAAGQERSAAGDLWSNARGMLWSPLTDDGDAFRLAVKLRLYIGEHETNDADEACVSVGRFWNTNPSVDECEELGSDPYAATRRAVVRAAAALAKDTP